MRKEKRGEISRDGEKGRERNRKSEKRRGERNRGEKKDTYSQRVRMGKKGKEGGEKGRE
jgi:hypothetical protein